MLTSRLLSTSLVAQSGGRAAAAAAAGLRRQGTAGGTGGSSTADDLATGAAGGRMPGDQEGQMKIHHAQNEVPEPNSALPPIGGYGDDPVAAGASTVSGAGEALKDAMSSAAGAASEATGSAAGAVYSTESAGEAMGSAKESAKHPGVHTSGDASVGEAPGSSGTAMPGATRWKKEADDAMQGGAPEPGVVLE